LEAQKYEARSFFLISGLRGEFTLMDCDLFRRSPGGRAVLDDQSADPVRNARAGRQAPGRLVDGGHSHHSSLGKTRGDSMDECCHAASDPVKVFCAAELDL